jgi:hypothetical protein
MVKESFFANDDDFQLITKVDACWDYIFETDKDFKFSLQVVAKQQPTRNRPIDVVLS